jgi:hypothetical protein
MSEARRPCGALSAAAQVPVFGAPVSHEDHGRRAVMRSHGEAANILFRKGLLTPQELALKMEEVEARSLRREGGGGSA